VAALENEKSGASNKVVTKTSQIYLDSEAVEKETPPDFRRKLESAIVLAGAKHCFECVVCGTQPFEIKWQKNGVDINNSENLVTTFNKTTGVANITITNASQADNALYSCRVSNELGMAETSAFLKVKGVIFFIIATFNC
jgi:hypothetical protein